MNLLVGSFSQPVNLSVERVQSAHNQWTSLWKGCSPLTTSEPLCGKGAVRSQPVNLSVERVQSAHNQWTSLWKGCSPLTTSEPLCGKGAGRNPEEILKWKIRNKTAKNQ